MTVSVKGGQNGIPHCHHDLGHFVIAVDGNEVVSDIGIGVYDKGTTNQFSFDLGYFRLDGGKSAAILYCFG
jgi:hypothetical protein